MKLLYLIAGTYRAAGMEKVLADKTNWLVRHGYDIVIATTDQRGQAPAFAMDPAIRISSSKHSRSRSRNGFTAGG